MTANTAYKQYKNNSVFTSTPEELTLMLYNGLIKFIGKGMAEMNDKKLDAANDSIIRAQDIVQEFMSTLDKRLEVSISLELLYDYMYRRLVEANINKNAEILEEILGYARELRDTWAEAMKIAKKQGMKRQEAK